MYYLDNYMGSERLNRNSLKYWTNLGRKARAKDLGYICNERFDNALDEFVNGLKEQEKEKRRVTNGEDGILTIALGVLGGGHFNGIKPPLEKRRKKKEEKKEERKMKRKKERRKKRIKRKKEKNKRTNFS